MNLYNMDLSPFCGRTRMQIYAKGLEIDIVAPPGFGTPEFAQINPTGKLPALQLENGRILPESETICEFLEDRFPDVPMRPHEDEARAQVRLLSRLADLYVMEPMTVLFGMINPDMRDQAVVDATVDQINNGLYYLDRFVNDGEYAVGNWLTLADCTLVPMLFFVNAVMPAFGLNDPTGPYPRLAAYFASVSKDPVAARVLDELQAALAHEIGEI